MVILESVWYGKIGIVKVQTEYQGVKYYIGNGNGFSQDEDEKLIAEWGSTFYPEIFDSNVVDNT